MGDMLSQAEIDALLNGTALSDFGIQTQPEDDALTSQEKDALGEIGNISMGSSATTLFTLLGHKVLITTPKVEVTTWDVISEDQSSSCVAVRVEYTHGLVGSNLLVLKESDVKIITDLMMGGDGSNIHGDLTDLHLSAISEAMNQMIGSAATSMSSMFNKRIDISPPKAFLINFESEQPYADFDDGQRLVKISFKIVIGNLIDSEIMQIIPLPFAKSLVENLLSMDMSEPVIPPVQSKPNQPKHEEIPIQREVPQAPSYEEPRRQEPQIQYAPPVQQPQPQEYGMGYINQGQVFQEPPKSRPQVNVQPAHFQAFDDRSIAVEKKNISLIMDVPLQITVELGRTHRTIRDILEFSPGSIIELDKLAGEPVDILVNGKQIAKGEVVVIDESFGVRITDIIDPSKRL